MLQILGHSDTNTVCECCGKKNLKSTVVLGDEFGERFYGSVCALRALGRQFTDAPAVKRLVAKAVAVQTKRDQTVAWFVKHWEIRDEFDKGNKTPWLLWARANAPYCNSRGVTPTELFADVLSQSSAAVAAI